jgi:4,5-DOPA dioxygenase extradiol
MAARIPPLFVSHGSPLLCLEPHTPAHQFLATALDRVLSESGAPRPRAVVVVSAHWEAATVAVTASPRPPQIYDMYGFPRALYEVLYTPPGEPALARRIVALLQAAGVTAHADAERGLDHGVWSPLTVMLPRADVPVIQVALHRDLDPALHLRIGHALAPLQHEGVLLLASGGAVHNLGTLRMGGGGVAPAEPWAARFDAHLRDVLVGTVGAERERALVQLPQHPDADRAHPTKEHLAPVYVAAGAGGDRPARLLYTGMQYGSLSMAAYAF